MRDYCENCPMYLNECDYSGGWDEGCYIHLDGWFNGKDYRWICKMPNLIKKLYIKYQQWKDERCWEKSINQYKESESKDERSN